MTSSPFFLDHPYVLCTCTGFTIGRSDGSARQASNPVSDRRHQQLVADRKRKRHARQRAAAIRQRAGVNITTATSLCRAYPTPKKLQFHHTSFNALLWIVTGPTVHIPIPHDQRAAVLQRRQKWQEQTAAFLQVAVCDCTALRDPHTCYYNQGFRSCPRPSPAEMEEHCRGMPQLQEVDPRGRHPPYAAMNPYMAAFTSPQPGHWWQCRSCQDLDKRRQRLRCLTFLPVDYLRWLRAADPLQMQMLSLVDVRLTLKRRLLGLQAAAFTLGQVVHPPLLDCTFHCS